MSERDLTTPRYQVFGTVKKGTECRICGRNVDDGRAVYCSDYCRSIANGVMNLLNWSSVRRRIIKRDNATCQECGFKQAWLDQGHNHLKALVKAQLPPEPEGPSITEYDEWEQDELEDYWDAANEWTDQRNALIEDYYGIEWRSRHYWPTAENRLEVDHITPVADGGHPFDPANLRTLCQDCHGEKTARENSERAGEDRYERPDIEAELADYVADGGRTLDADKRGGGD